MGINDFWLNPGNKKEQLNPNLHGVREDQIDAKHKKLFNIFDINQDGTLEQEEVSIIESWAKGIAGLDNDKNTLSSFESFLGSIIFAEQAEIENIEDVDFLGFLQNLSKASEDVVSVENEVKTYPVSGDYEVGERVIKTTYKDGSVQIIHFYPNGEIKQKITLDAPKANNSWAEFNPAEKLDYTPTRDGLSPFKNTHIEHSSRYQKEIEAKKIAQNLLNTLKQNQGLLNSNAFQSVVNNITSENVLLVFSEFEKISPNKSLIEYLTKTSTNHDSLIRTNLLGKNGIYTKLFQKAKDIGMNYEKISNLQQAITEEIDNTLKGIEVGKNKERLVGTDILVRNTIQMYANNPEYLKRMQTPDYRVQKQYDAEQKRATVAYSRNLVVSAREQLEAHLEYLKENMVHSLGEIIIEDIKMWGFEGTPLSRGLTQAIAYVAKAVGFESGSVDGFFKSIHTKIAEYKELEAKLIRLENSAESSTQFESEYEKLMGISYNPENMNALSYLSQNPPWANDPKYIEYRQKVNIELSKLQKGEISQLEYLERLKNIEPYKPDESTKEAKAYTKQMESLMQVIAGKDFSEDVVKFMTTSGNLGSLVETVIFLYSLSAQAGTTMLDFAIARSSLNFADDALKLTDLSDKLGWTDKNSFENILGNRTDLTFGGVLVGKENSKNFGRSLDVVASWVKGEITPEQAKEAFKDIEGFSFDDFVTSTGGQFVLNTLSTAAFQAAMNYAAPYIQKAGKAGTKLGQNLGAKKAPDINKLTYEILSQNPQGVNAVDLLTQLAKSSMTGNAVGIGAQFLAETAVFYATNLSLSVIQEVLSESNTELEDAFKKGPAEFAEYLALRFKDEAVNLLEIKSIGMIIAMLMGTSAEGRIREHYSQSEALKNTKITIEDVKGVEGVADGKYITVSGPNGKIFIDGSLNKYSPDVQVKTNDSGAQTVDPITNMRSILDLVMAYEAPIKDYINKKQQEIKPEKVVVDAEAVEIKPVDFSGVITEKAFCAPSEELPTIDGLVPKIIPDKEIEVIARKFKFTDEELEQYRSQYPAFNNLLYAWSLDVTECTPHEIKALRDAIKNMDPNEIPFEVWNYINKDNIDKISSEGLDDISDILNNILEKIANHIASQYTDEASKVIMDVKSIDAQAKYTLSTINKDKPQFAAAMLGVINKLEALGYKRTLSSEIINFASKSYDVDPELTIQVLLKSVDRGLSTERYDFYFNIGNLEAIAKDPVCTRKLLSLTYTNSKGETVPVFQNRGIETCVELVSSLPAEKQELVFNWLQLTYYTKLDNSVELRFSTWEMESLLEAYEINKDLTEKLVNLERSINAADILELVKANNGNEELIEEYLLAKNESFGYTTYLCNPEHIVKIISIKNSDPEAFELLNIPSFKKGLTHILAVYNISPEKVKSLMQAQYADKEDPIYEPQGISLIMHAYRRNPELTDILVEKEYDAINDNGDIVKRKSFNPRNIEKLVSKNNPTLVLDVVNATVTDASGKVTTAFGANDVVALVNHFEQDVESYYELKPWLVENRLLGADNLVSLSKTQQRFDREIKKAEVKAQKAEAKKKSALEPEIPRTASMEEVDSRLTSLGLHPKMAANYTKLCHTNGIVDARKADAIVELVKAFISTNDKGKLVVGISPKEIEAIFDFAVGHQLSTKNGEFRDKLAFDVARLKECGITDIKLAMNISAVINMGEIELKARLNSNIRKDIAERVKSLPEEIKANLKSKGLDVAVIEQRALVESKGGKVSRDNSAKTATLRTYDSIEGVEKVVLNKFKDEVPQEIWADPEQFKTWAEKKLEAILDFDNNTNLQATGQYAYYNPNRKEGIETWYKYLTTESHYKDDVFVHLLVMDGITREMRPDNAYTPPAISHAVFEETYNALLANDTKVSFSKIYAARTRARAIEQYGGEKVSINGVEGQWVTIPRSQRGSVGYEDNIAMVQALAEGSSWCLRFENAHTYLQHGNIHYFIDKDGLAQVAMNETDGKITQIQKRYNQDSTVPIPYAEVVANFAKTNNYTGEEDRIQKALKSKAEFDKLKAELSDLMAKKDYLAVFEKMGRRATVNENGQYVLSRYDNRIGEFTLKELGVKEDELMENVVEIISGMHLEGSNLTILPNLKSIGTYITISDSDFAGFVALEKVGSRSVRWNKPTPKPVEQKSIESTLEPVPADVEVKIYGTNNGEFVVKAGNQQISAKTLSEAVDVFTKLAPNRSVDLSEIEYIDDIASQDAYKIQDETQPSQSTERKYTTSLATEKDLAQVHKIDLEAFDGNYSIDRSFADYKSDLEAQEIETHVIKSEDGRVTGYYQLEPIENGELYIYSIGVDKALRNTRASYEAIKKMQEEITNFAIEKGVEKVVLDVDASHENLVKLYKKLGFKITDESHGVEAGNAYYDYRMEIDVKEYLEGLSSKTEAQAIKDYSQISDAELEAMKKGFKDHPFYIDNPVFNWTKERIILMDKIASNDALAKCFEKNVFGWNKLLTQLQIVSSYTLGITMTVLDKVLSDEKIYTNETVMSDLDSLLDVTDTPERLELTLKYLSDEKLYTNETLSLYIVELVNLAKSENRAKLVDVILSNECLSSNSNAILIVETVIKPNNVVPALPAIAKYLDKISNIEELQKDIKEFISLITHATKINTENVDFKLAIIDRLLGEKRIVESENFMDILKSALEATSSESDLNAKVAILDKILSDESLIGNENIQKCLPSYLKAAAADNMPLLEKILSDERLYGIVTLDHQISYLANTYQAPEIIEAKFEIIDRFLENPKLQDNRYFIFALANIIGLKPLPNFTEAMFSRTGYESKPEEEYNVEATLKVLNIKKAILDMYLTNEKLSENEQFEQTLGLIMTCVGSKLPTVAELTKFLNVLKEAQEKKIQLRSANEVITDDIINNAFAGNINNVIDAIELMGESTFVHSYTMKFEGVFSLVQDIKILKVDLKPEDYNKLLLKLNPESSDEYKALEQKIRELKKSFPQVKASGDAQALKNLQSEIATATKELQNIRKSKVDLDPQRVLERIRVLHAIIGRSPEDVPEFIDLIQNGTKENEALWRNKVNDYIFTALGMEFDPVLSAKLDLTRSKYLPEILTSNPAFKTGFKEILKLMQKNPDKSLEEIFDALPQNIETRRLLEGYGIDYERYTRTDKDSHIDVKVELSVEKSRKAAIEALEAEFNNAAFNLLPKDETNKIYNALKEIGIEAKPVIETIFGEADGIALGTREVIRLYKNGEPIVFDDLAPIMKTIKKVISENSFWTTKSQDTTLQSYKETVYTHLTKDRDIQYKTAKDLKEDRSVELEVRQTDMNDISHSLFLGNQGACCTAVGTGGNQYSAPNYIKNKMITAIEVVANGEFVGNTMCYIALVDGKPALILENIELKADYHNNDAIRDAMVEYAKQLCVEIGKPDLEIYAGPHRHKLDMKVYDKAEHEMTIIGNTGNDEIYLDFITTGRQINGPETDKVQLYRLSDAKGAQKTSSAPKQPYVAPRLDINEWQLADPIAAKPEDDGKGFWRSFKEYLGFSSKDKAVEAPSTQASAPQAGEVKPEVKPEIAPKKPTIPSVAGVPLPKVSQAGPKVVWEPVGEIPVKTPVQNHFEGYRKADGSVDIDKFVDYLVNQRKALENPDNIVIKEIIDAYRASEIPALAQKYPLSMQYLVNALENGFGTSQANRKMADSSYYTDAKFFERLEKYLEKGWVFDDIRSYAELDKEIKMNANRMGKVEDFSPATQKLYFEILTKSPGMLPEKIIDFVLKYFPNEEFFVQCLKNPKILDEINDMFSKSFDEIYKRPKSNAFREEYNDFDKILNIRKVQEQLVLMQMFYPENYEKLLKSKGFEAVLLNFNPQKLRLLENIRYDQPVTDTNLAGVDVKEIVESNSYKRWEDLNRPETITSISLSTRGNKFETDLEGFAEHNGYKLSKTTSANGNIEYTLYDSNGKFLKRFHRGAYSVIKVEQALLDVAGRQEGSFTYTTDGNRFTITLQGKTQTFNSLNEVRKAYPKLRLDSEVNGFVMFNDESYQARKSRNNSL